MALAEIQNSKPIENPGISTVRNISISKSIKEKDFEYAAVPEIDTSKKTDEIKKASAEKIQRVSELMNDYIRSIQRDIKIQVNTETGDIIVKVISEETGKVIREIPSEVMLALAARMEEISGAFIDQTV